jgi:hypothetical protein
MTGLAYAAAAGADHHLRLLAVPLRSYVQPLVIMSVIPFGAVGAIVGHWIMGELLVFFSARHRRAVRRGGELQPGAGGLHQPPAPRRRPMHEAC